MKLGVNCELIGPGSNVLVIPTRRARSVRDIGHDLTLRQLRSVPVFADCSDEQLDDFAARSTEVRFAVGATVAAAGELACEVFVVLDGYAGVEAEGVPIIVLGPGAVIGGPEALVGSLHQFSVIAQTPMVLRSITGVGFAQIVATAPTFAAALIQQLGGRTRTVLDELACARQGSVSPRGGSTRGSGARHSLGAVSRGRT